MKIKKTLMIVFYSSFLVMAQEKSDIENRLFNSDYFVRVDAFYQINKIIDSTRKAEIIRRFFVMHSDTVKSDFQRFEKTKIFTSEYRGDESGVFNNDVLNMSLPYLTPNEVMSLLSYASQDDLIDKIVQWGESVYDEVVNSLDDPYKVTRLNSIRVLLKWMNVNDSKFKLSKEVKRSVIKKITDRYPKEKSIWVREFAIVDIGMSNQVEFIPLLKKISKEDKVYDKIRKEYPLRKAAETAINNLEKIH